VEVWRPGSSHARDKTSTASQHRHDIEFRQPVTMNDASQALTATTAFFSLLTDAADMPSIVLPAAHPCRQPARLLTPSAVCRLNVAIGASWIGTLFPCLPTKRQANRDAGLRPMMPHNPGAITCRGETSLSRHP
jgi:hypothetical protein